MAVFTSIGGAGVILRDVVGIAPSLALLLLLAGVVAAVIYAYRPPLPQTMAFSFLPWVVTGAFLDALASGGGYPPYLVPVFTGPGAYLSAILVPGVAWVAMLNLSVSRHELPAYHHYIATMGIGAVAILWSALILDLGAPRLARMLVLVLVPLVALLATGLVALSIGFWSPDFLEYTAITGGFTVFGALVNGIATTTNVAVYGEAGHTVFSATVQEIVAVTAPNGVAGVDVTHLWVWLFLVTNIAIGIHVATSLAPYADRSPRTVHTLLGIVGVVAFALGFDNLLLLVVR